MATIRDVARAAGVSIATVSRVFNQNDLVNAETARRVLQSAAAMDYWPNSAARSLTTNCTYTVGVILPDLYGEFFSEIIRGIDSAAREKRYQLLLSSSHASVEDVVSASRAMLGRIDGLILMAPDRVSLETASSIRRRVPVVLVNPSVDVTGCDSVAIDNVGGAHAATSHLIGLGHRNVAMVAGPMENSDAVERMRGFRQALVDHDLDPDAALVVPGDFHERSGYEAARALTMGRKRPSAVFAANDNMAIGLLSALSEQGLHVPRDLAVVGFDNQKATRYLNPSLTTVDVDAHAIGRRATSMMLERLRATEESADERRVFPARLVIRRSCGATPGDGSATKLLPDAHTSQG